MLKEIFLHREDLKNYFLTCLMILGCRQCAGTSNTVHLQCAFSLFDILAYIRNHGRTIICRKILQGEKALNSKPKDSIQLGILFLVRRCQWNNT